jgi:hypothetical protein
MITTLTGPVEKCPVNLNVTARFYAPSGSKIPFQWGMPDGTVYGDPNFVAVVPTGGKYVDTKLYGAQVKSTTQWHVRIEDVHSGKYADAPFSVVCPIPVGTLTVMPTKL